MSGTVQQTLLARQALVTGASRGIGYQIALQLAQAGANVCVVSSSPKRIKAAAARITKLTGREAVGIAANLRTAAGCRAAFAKVSRSASRLDVLINSAGDAKGGDFLKQPDREWTDGLGLKFYACVRMCRLCWPLLAKSHGAVVNIIGGFARTPDCDFMVPGAANAAVANFTKALAGRGKRDDVVVNAIHPGLTETERVETIFASRAKLSGKSKARVRKEQIASEGIRRLGTPADIAALAVFLCSEQARHIRGTSIAVDGGGGPALF